MYFDFLDVPSLHLERYDSLLIGSPSTLTFVTLDGAGLSDLTPYLLASVDPSFFTMAFSFGFTSLTPTDVSSTGGDGGVSVSVGAPLIVPDGTVSKTTRQPISKPQLTFRGRSNTIKIIVLLFLR